MKRLLLFLALLVPSVAIRAEFRLSKHLLGPTGRPLAGAVVTVCSSSGIASLQPDREYFKLCWGGISNPTFSDGLGNLQFWAPPGTYIYTVTGNGIHTLYASLFCLASLEPLAPTAGILPIHLWLLARHLVFAATVSASFSITLTGNVTSSTITGTPINGNLLSLTLVEDGKVDALSPFRGISLSRLDIRSTRPLLTPMR